MIFALGKRFQCTVVVALFILLGISVTDVQAQLLIGPRIGGQMSWVSYEDDEVSGLYDVDPLYGWFGGMTVAFRVRDRFFLQTDFIYSRKGKEIKGIGDAGLSDPDLKYVSINHHFDIPIIYRMDFKGKLGENLVYKYFIGAGPNVSYWWKGNGTFTSGFLQDELRISELEYDVKFREEEEGDELGILLVPDANRLQLGINFATGIVLEPSRGGVYILDFRFEYGHTYTYKDSPGTLVGLESVFSDPVKGRNLGFRLGFSYLLDTKISERKKGKSTGKDKR